MKKLLGKLHTPNWLAILLVVVIILRVPSFFEPYSYGDELIYLTLGEAVRQGVPLYKGIHDNKPPFLYLTAALAGNLFWFKVILAAWHLVTVFIFWKLSEKLFPKNGVLQKVATVIFALLTTIPLLEGNIVNAELFMIGPTMLAFYLLLSKKLTPKILVGSGLLFSISILFKVPAVFDIPAIVFYWFITTKRLTKKSFAKMFAKAVYLAIGIALPILASFVWYGARGAFNQYLVAAFMQNVGYLSSFRPGDVTEPFLVRNLPLLTRAAIVALGLVILYWKRRKFSKQFVFITAWLLLTLFAVTLSERPYPHYLIQSMGPVALLLGMLFTQKSIEQVYTIVPLTLTFLVPVYFHFWHYQTLPYYQRFVRLATGKITRQEYLTSFGGQVARNYAVSEYVKSTTKPDEKIFVWGDGVAIYALSHRLPPIKYVADYHIKDFSSEAEVLGDLNSNPPKLFIIQPDAPALGSLDRFLKLNYGLIDNIDGTQVWMLLNPSVRSLLAS